MIESKLRNALESPDSGITDNGVNCRMSGARTAERILRRDLDTVVSTHEKMYAALLELRQVKKRETRANAAPTFELDPVPSPLDSGAPKLRRKYATRSTDGPLARDFYEYLLASGYTEYTKSGNRGTAYSYKNAVDKVCEWEDCSLDELSERIGRVVREYSPDGIKAKLGMKSNRTVINGLRAFERFCATREYHRPS